MTVLPDGTKIENWTTAMIRFTDPRNEFDVVIKPESGGPAYVRPIYVATRESGYITRTTWDMNSSVPKPKAGTYFIVSKVVKSALPMREDLVLPSDILRTVDGTPICCRRFTI